MTGLHDIAVAVLLGLSALLGVRAVPEPPPGWDVVRAWEPEGGRLELRARSRALVDACRADPSAWVEFPRVPHGAQAVLLDGRAVARVGPVAGGAGPAVRCESLMHGRRLEWVAWSSTRYFARVAFFPRPTHRARPDRFFDEVLPLMAGGSLVVGGMFCLIAFQRSTPSGLRLSLVIACLAFATCCLASVAGRAGMPPSTLAAQRLAGASLLIGSAAFANVLRIEGLVARWLSRVYLGVVTTGVALHAVAPSGDVSQLASLVPVPWTAAVLLAAGGAAFRRARGRGLPLGSLLESISVVCLVAPFVHDLAVAMGLVTGLPLAPLGLLGGATFLALALHARVMDAFRERDFLRAHLEAEVRRQTLEARRRARELGESLADLRRTQAQLVHSEKMASLGVLVAGVAHELNNPISFIANTAEPLQQLVAEIRAAAERDARDVVSAGLARVAGVVDVIRRGAERTAGIVADLRSFSRRGSGESTVTDLHEGIEVSLRLLRARWAGRIEVVRDYGPPLQVVAPSGELNQVLMNLLANACDAIPAAGHLWIRTRIGPDHVTIAVRDDGVGIAPDDLPRIFDPFFTTKAPGKGTGLGLAVSHAVVARLGGTLAVESAPGAGTTMTVALPVAMLAQRERRANAR